MNTTINKTFKLSGNPYNIIKLLIDLHNFTLSKVIKLDKQYIQKLIDFNLSLEYIFEENKECITITLYLGNLYEGEGTELLEGIYNEYSEKLFLEITKEIQKGLVKNYQITAISKK